MVEIENITEIRPRVLGEFHVCLLYTSDAADE